MSHEYICPCCQEGELELTLPAGPNEPYKVECPFCGTRFDHDLLGEGYNGAKRFLMNIEWVAPDD